MYTQGNHCHVKRKSKPAAFLTKSVCKAQDYFSKKNQH